MQIDGTLNKLSTVCTKFVVYRLLFYLNSCICKHCRDILILIEADSPGILQSAGFFFFFFFGISLLAFSYKYIFFFWFIFWPFFHIQLREYIDDTEDYINIQVNGWTTWYLTPKTELNWLIILMESFYMY